MAKTIAVFSTKGGVGKTLISTNLAVSLVKDQFKRVCLVDFDLQLPGDMARMLNIAPEKSALDLFAYLGRATSTLIPPTSQKRYDFITKTSFGLDFLPGILKPQQANNFSADKIKDAFDFLGSHYDYIVVDVGKSFSESFVATLNQCNLILLVVTPDILSIYQTRWALDTLQYLQIPLSMVKIVLNRAESISSISLEEIKTKLPIEIITSLTSEGKVIGLAVNCGIPVVLDNPRIKFSQGITKLSSLLASNPKIFIEHKNVDQLKLKETEPEKADDFWVKFGLAEAAAPVQVEEEEILILKRRIHSRLIEKLNIKKLDMKVFSDPAKKKELKNKAEMLISNLLVEESGVFISSPEVRKKLVKEITDEALGFGPLEDLLADPEITDIMVNNKDEIYIERKGKLEPTNKKFISNEQVKIVIERIIAPIGRRIDESVPMVDARLPDGSRVNSIIPPLSLGGPTLTIRKFRKERFKAEELISLNTFNANILQFIQACVLTRKNIIVSGGTGSGKTTILNVFSSFIPNNERIITIEDAAELKIERVNTISLETRTPDADGKGGVSLRDLIRNALRMAPDRLIVGEVRGEEAIDMLQAMATGHTGTIGIVHGNSPKDVLARLETMVMMSGINLPLGEVRKVIASTINVIVHIERLRDGTRKVTHITEVRGLDREEIVLNDLFVFRFEKIAEDGTVVGKLKPSIKFYPLFFQKFQQMGLLADNVFVNEQ